VALLVPRTELVKRLKTGVSRRGPQIAWPPESARRVYDPIGTGLEVLEVNRLSAALFFQSRKALRFASCFRGGRSFRRREHCQDGGGGRRGHYLDKRNHAIQSPAANTKPD
jgi:hypothetical protein